VDQEGFFSERSIRSVERNEIFKPFNHFVFVWRRSCSQLSTEEGLGLLLLLPSDRECMFHCISYPCDPGTSIEELSVRAAHRA
jgi:hypothetical protein